MKIAGWNIAEAFARKYPKSRPRLQNWRMHVQYATWEKPVDVMKTFNSVRHVPIKGAWVFNIGSDRLITVIDFSLNTVLIRQAITHREYMKWSNRK